MLPPRTERSGGPEAGRLRESFATSRVTQGDSLPLPCSMLRGLLSFLLVPCLLELSGHVTAHFALGLGVDPEGAISHQGEEDPTAVVLRLHLSAIRESQEILGKAEDIEN